jgi:tetratricopeptide (TPR) repeat protein
VAGTFCSRNQRVILSLVLAIGTWITFSPVIGNQFINYDDPEYVTKNPHVNSGLSVNNAAWAFTTVYAANWHPLTWLSHMLDVSMFGLNPGWHHGVSLLLHVGNVVLLFYLLLRMTGSVWRSGFVAAFFALHPLHVQSVAWIAERKDVLSTFFGLVTLQCYVTYCQRPTTERRDASAAGKKQSIMSHGVAYWLALVFFAFGLMSKPMLVTLPLLMLLLDYWPLKRVEAISWLGVKAVIPEKLPFAALAMGSSVITFIAQHSAGAVASVKTLGLGTRVQNAITAYGAYLRKTLWPADLAVFYPQLMEVPTWRVLFAALCLVALTMWAWYSMRRNRAIFVGWCWFVITLLPVIGLVQVGGQAMADRYSYVPLIGVFIMLSWSLPAGVGTRGIGASVFAVAIVAVMVSAMFTRNEVRYWHDSAALFRRALAVTSQNHIAHTALGFYLASGGENHEAEQHFLAAMRLQPTFALPYNYMGNIRALEGKKEEAQGYYEKAVSLDAKYADAHLGLANVLARQGRLQPALEHYELARKGDADPAEIDLQTGRVLAGMGKLDAAEPLLRRACEAHPEKAETHLYLGQVLQQQGRFSEAVAEYRKSIELRPDSIEALNNLAWILATNPNTELKNAEEAVRLATRACTLSEFKRPSMLGTLGAAYAAAGRFDDAILTTEKGLELARAQGQKGLAEATEGRLQLYRDGKTYVEQPPP